MKSVLVIANLHHASPRIPALLFHLADHGWRATVITPPLGKNAEAVLGLPTGFLERVDIVEAPFRGDIFWFWRRLLGWFGFSGGSSYTEQIKERVSGGRRGWVDRAMRAYQTVFAIPDTEWPWHRPAIRAAKGLLARRRYDALLSSSPFPTVHRVAARICQEWNIPWVADLRDLWSQNHNYPYPSIRRWLDRRIELSTLRHAAMLTTVSGPWRDSLAALHGDRVAVVRNGFQPLAPVNDPAPLRHFTIRYTGNIYAGKQDPAKILLALQRGIQSGVLARHRIRLEFFGRHESALAALIQEYALADVAMQRGMLPRAEIRRLQREAHLLLLLQWEEPGQSGVFPLKFYEYLDAERPILATGTGGSEEIDDLLRETGAGIAAAGVEEIEAALGLAYQQYLLQGKVDYHGRREPIDRHSYSGCAQSMATCLDRISTRP